MEAPREVIYHVNSYRVPCVGMAPMSCLQVRRGDAAVGEWQNFYSQIRGFDYEPGYLYRLRVRETPLPPEQVPADASSIRYELVEVLDREPDPRMRIHDIWALERVDGSSIDSFDADSRREAPYMEFNVKRREYFGNDGCNPVRGAILEVGAEELRLDSGTYDDTTHSCGDGMLQSQFAAAIARVARWQREGLELALLDDNGLEVLALRKID
jgi:heat shock protein HslJ